LRRAKKEKSFQFFIRREEENYISEGKKEDKESKKKMLCLKEQICKHNVEM
jgi:hypothetical protein